MFQRLQEHTQIPSRNKLVAVFILDEAQFLPQAILNYLRPILALRMDSKHNAMLVLCGQNHFIGQLNLVAMNLYVSASAYTMSLRG